MHSDRDGWGNGLHARSVRGLKQGDDRSLDACATHGHKYQIILIPGGGRIIAGDLVQPLASGVLARERVRAELAELVAGAHPGRVSRNEITLFKSVGTALEDLCAACLVAQRVPLG